MKLPEQSWQQVVQTTAVCAIVVSPFWFLASRIDDLDELLKSGVGATLAAVALGVLKFASGRQKE